MKLIIRRNYELKTMFLKIKNGDRWAKIQRNAQWIPRIEGWTDNNCQTMWVVEWILIYFMKLKHKMKLWTNMKFSPNQNQKWFKLSCDICTEINDLNMLPNIQHITQVVFSIRGTFFNEIHPTSPLRPNECYSHWSMRIGKEVSCEIYTQLHQKYIFSRYKA
jgi:hypothetical protein